MQLPASEPPRHALARAAPAYCLPPRHWRMSLSFKRRGSVFVYILFINGNGRRTHRPSVGRRSQCTPSAASARAASPWRTLPRAAPCLGSRIWMQKMGSKGTELADRVRTGCVGSLGKGTVMKCYELTLFRRRKADSAPKFLEPSPLPEPISSTSNGVPDSETGTSWQLRVELAFGVRQVRTAVCTGSIHHTIIIS